MITIRRIPFLLLAIAVAIPMFGAIAADVTIPIAGYANGAGDVHYRTEITITNYRDKPQYIQMSFVQDGYAGAMYIFPIDPLETVFLPSGGFASSPTEVLPTHIGALRLQTFAIQQNGSMGAEDPEGRIEANAFIVAERGRFAKNGSSRQEIAGIPSSDYKAEEAVFLGVQHSLGNGKYTNVGVANLDPVKTVTFYAEFQYMAPVAIVVPPNSLRQIRLPGEGNGGNYVRVYPEWALTSQPAANATPWVAYASTIDTLTGDAFSGMRVPAATRYEKAEQP